MKLTELTWLNCPECGGNFEYPVPGGALGGEVWSLQVKLEYPGEEWRFLLTTCRACEKGISIWWRKS